MDFQKVLAVLTASVLLATLGASIYYGDDDPDLTWSYMESLNPEAAETLSGYTGDLTLRTAAHFAILDGGWYDYSVYLRSTMYDVQEGHHMVAAISTLPVATGYADWKAEETDDYSFTMDLGNSRVSIPIAGD